MSRQLLAFGGPWNEQVIAIPDRTPVVQAAMPEKSLTSPYPVAVTDSAFRLVHYRVEKLVFHDERTCPGRPLCDERCHWFGFCLIADGYPHDRITDQMNAILALCSWPWPFGPF